MTNSNSIMPSGQKSTCPESVATEVGAMVGEAIGALDVGRGVGGLLVGAGMTGTDDGPGNVGKEVGVMVGGAVAALDVG